MKLCELLRDLLRAHAGSLEEARSPLVFQRSARGRLGCAVSDLTDRTFLFPLPQHPVCVLAAFTAEKQVQEVEAQASLLLDRLKPLRVLEENLSRNLSEIKELIRQARKQAASVSSTTLNRLHCRL